MIKLYYIIIIALLLSCDNRVDDLQLLNENPVAEIKSLNTWSESINQQYIIQIVDTVKFGNEYLFNHNINDDNKDLKLILQGDYQGGLQLKTGTVFNAFSDSIKLNQKLNTLKFTPSTTGENIIKFITKDALGVTFENKITLNCFLNKLPVSNLQVNQIQNIGQNVYEFNGTQSFDRDDKFGGGLVEYWFEVRQNSNLVYQITGNNPVVNYDFNTVGTFDVSLRVRDNDNVWSTYQYETIIVQ